MSDTIQYEVKPQSRATVAPPKVYELTDANIREYITVTTPKLYILTPCFGSVCLVNYVLCLIETINLFKHFGFPVQVEFCKNDSLVTRARNNLVAKAMNDPAMTHMIFVDNDITWNPMDVMKLALNNKPLIGGVYPLKKYYFDKLTEPGVIQRWVAAKNTAKLPFTDDQVIQAKLLHYNVNYLNHTATISQNLAKVRHIATGFMMIQRHVITQLSHAFPSTKYVDDVGFLQGDENNHAYALFDCGVEYGHYLSEDWLFCERWTKLNQNNEVFIDVSINLTHTGQTDYVGSYMASIV